MRPRAHGCVFFAMLLACEGRLRPAALESPTDWGTATDVYVRPDAVPIADRSSTCGGTRIELTRRRADVLFLVDRSGSMTEATTDGASKWYAMLRAFRDVLPRVQSDLTMGLVLFPRASVALSPSPVEACSVATTLDVEPVANNAAAVLTALNLASPYGATPTWAALQAAIGYWRSVPDRTGSRYVVLATDGGPNCNGLFDNRTCRCSTANAALCRNDANVFARYNCLDDARTVAAIGDLFAMEVPTYVIGLPGTEEFGDVLSAMALAGGRARSGRPRYYPVSTSEELLREFFGITSGLVECGIRLNAAPADANLVDVRLGGESIIHDTGHLDGWDWRGEDHLDIDFFGPTCDRVRASSGGTVLNAAFGCPAPTPP